jgi:hypothetical protein
MTAPLRPEYVLLLALAVLVAGLVWNMYWLTRFCVRLMRYEHLVWVRLGEPMPVPWKRQQIRQVVAYLSSGQHHALGDREVVRLGDALRSARRAALYCMLLACGLAAPIVLFVKP